MDCGLLDRMYKLVGEEPVSFSRSRSVAAFPENDMFANGVGVSIHCVRGLGGSVVAVDAHAREVKAESRLHKGASSRSQRLPWRTDNLMDNMRGF